MFSHKPVLFNAKYKQDDIYNQMGLIVDSLMRCCFKQMSSDNISIILVCFNNFKSLFESINIEKHADKLKKTRNDNIVSYSLKANVS